MTEQALRCGWCDTLLRPGTKPETTGVCQRCAGEVEARTWQPRMEREIAQILGSTTSGAQNAPDFDRLTPEESAAKADAVRAAWAETQTDQRPGGNGLDIGCRIEAIPGNRPGCTQRADSQLHDKAGSNPVWSTFTPSPPAPYVPRNRVDPVRVACYVACALLLGVVWGQVLRWAL